jgi:hypothetical protein
MRTPTLSPETGVTEPGLQACSPHSHTLHGDVPDNPRGRIAREYSLERKRCLSTDTSGNTRTFEGSSPRYPYCFTS